jgi:hypothetical protein
MDVTSAKKGVIQKKSIFIKRLIIVKVFLLFLILEVNGQIVSEEFVSEEFLMKVILESNSKTYPKDKDLRRIKTK